jgi:hypothetical protein
VEKQESVLTAEEKAAILECVRDLGCKEYWGSSPRKLVTQEAKYVERWPNTTSAWAGWSRFDIPVDRYGGVHSLLICTSSILGSPTCHRRGLASRKYLFNKI